MAKDCFNMASRWIYNIYISVLFLRLYAILSPLRSYTIDTNLAESAVVNARTYHSVNYVGCDKLSHAEIYIYRASTVHPNEWVPEESADVQSAWWLDLQYKSRLSS